MTCLDQHSRLMALPTELRVHILEQLFEQNITNDGFSGHGGLGGLYLDDDFQASSNLAILLTCRQLYNEGHLLAFSKTPFMISNLFFRVPERLSILQPSKISAIRSIAFVADARHFRTLLAWGEYPFGMSDLRLETLTIVLHRSSFWHYLFDFTANMVHLLRNLRNVKRIVFVRNAALVKGTLKAWYNRLVGLIMKIDHRERYLLEGVPPRLPTTWWKWKFDDLGQKFDLEACEPAPLVEEEEYMVGIQPLMMSLMQSIEDEEWNPDPRSRQHYY